MMKVSIIIPIYNIEELLEQCVDSVVSQTYDNKEIILIDDGSTDSSPVICDNYAKKYSKLILVCVKQELLPCRYFEL